MLILHSEPCTVEIQGKKKGQSGINCSTLECALLKDKLWFSHKLLDWSFLSRAVQGVQRAERGAPFTLAIPRLPAASHCCGTAVSSDRSPEHPLSRFSDVDLSLAITKVVQRTEIKVKKSNNNNQSTLMAVVDSSWKWKINSWLLKKWLKVKYRNCFCGVQPPAPARGCLFPWRRHHQFW